MGSGDQAELAVKKMVDFLESDFQLSIHQTIYEIDKLLEDSVFTAEQVFNSMVNGLIVSDEDDIVTVFNPAEGARNFKKC